MQRSTDSMTVRDPARQMYNQFMGDMEDPFLSTWMTSALAPWNSSERSKLLNSRGGMMSCMRMDAYEMDDGFHVHCECPGVPKEKIDCSVENNCLTIKIRKEAPEGLEDCNPRCKERCFGSCQRSIMLPNNVDVTKVQCCNKDGVLCINFPKLGGTVAVKKLAIA